MGVVVPVGPDRQRMNGGGAYWAVCSVRKINLLLIGSNDVWIFVCFTVEWIRSKISKFYSIYGFDSFIWVEIIICWKILFINERLSELFGADVKTRDRWPMVVCTGQRPCTYWGPGPAKCLRMCMYRSGVSVYVRVLSKSRVPSWKAGVGCFISLEIEIAFGGNICSISIIENRRNAE